MTWGEYWDDDCAKVKYYRKAHKLKTRMKNHELWLQGLYVYEAIADLTPVLRFSMDKKPKKPLDYPAEPYAIDEEEIRERKRKQEEERVKRFKGKMSAWAIRTNKAMANKEEVKAHE